MSARWLDAAWPGGDYRRVANDAEGWADLVARSRDHVLVVEATGVYFRGLAIAAIEAGVSVRVVNPAQVRAFAHARLDRTKTDKVDARLILAFGERMLPDLPRWWPTPDGLQRVMALVRLADGLLRHRVAAGNRAHALQFVDEVVLGVSEQLEARLRSERERVMQQALELAKQDELAGGWLERLVELPGFGEVASLRFLAYAGDLRRFSTGRHFASYTGLAPVFAQSGDGVMTGRMSRVGPRALRGILYWAALPATQSKGQVGVMYRRMVESGKPPKKAVIAVANRLARAAWSVCVK